MGKRVLVGLVAVAAVFGMKFYNKSSSSKEVKTHLVSLCEGDAACARAVETHFEACFESSYKLGGRRRSSRLEAGQLVECINSRSGKAYFAFNEKKE